MLSIQRILIDGAIVASLSILILLVAALVNPRILLNDYPKPIQAQVPPRSEAEKWQGLIAGRLFMLVLLGGPLISTWMLERRSTGASFGALFVNPSDLLQGKGKVHRHVKLYQLSDLENPALSELVRAAVLAEADQSPYRSRVLVPHVG